MRSDYAASSFGVAWFVIGRHADFEVLGCVSPYETGGG